MKAVLQRVAEASVVADGLPAGACDKGLLILIGITAGDNERDAVLLADKIVKMRIFSDENDKMNLSCIDIGGDALVVSNFTLNANYSKGNRPDYFSGASPAEAERLYLYFVELLKERLQRVETGVFGADMKITAVCDGPVTICMDSVNLRKGNEK